MERNAKSVLFELLDNMDGGVTFTGSSLQYHVQSITGDYHYPSTMLRYMREWRSVNRKIVCLEKRKSLYEMIEYKRR